MIEGAKKKRRFIVNKTVIIVLALVMVATVGCKKSEEAGKVSAPQVAVQSVTPPVQAPAGVPAGGNPHAGLKLKEMAAGTGHKGKVLQIMDAGSYTYLEVEEKGQKLWVAALKVKVAKGDTVEFPDSSPMENFKSKILNRTFDKILFVESLRVVK